VRANFPCSLCLVVRDSELWKCGRANAPGDRQRANVAADESGAISTKKLQNLIKSIIHCGCCLVATALHSSQ
jgi:hypothetical protein